jgi:hypothetical protein
MLRIVVVESLWKPLIDGLMLKDKRVLLIILVDANFG